jgi:hypothetical protein
MPQSSFPASAVFLTGPRVVGKTGSGFGLADELEVKTINGNSIFGSGDLSISASPAGSDTQIQLNSSGSFGGTSRLTWTDGNGMALTATGDASVVFRINPPTGSAYQHNVPLVWTVGPGAIQTGIGTLAANVSAYNFGANLELGGDTDQLWSATQPAIGIRLESNYITNRRGFNERFVEYHLTYTPMHNSTNTTAGQHIRFMSTEIGTGWNVNTGAGEPGFDSYVNTYLSCGGFDLRLPRSDAQGAVYFAVQAGNLKFSDSAGTNANNFDIFHNATYTQFNTTGSFIFNKAVLVGSSLQVNGGITSTNTDPASSLVVYGGITAGGEIFSNAQGLKATKSVTANNSFDLYDYSIYGTPTTQPAALTGAIRLIVTNTGTDLELRAKGPTGSTVLLATLPLPA